MLADASVALEKQKRETKQSSSSLESIVEEKVNELSLDGGVEQDEDEGHSLESTKRKRRAKMNKHKYRKRLKKERFLRRKHGN